MKKHFTKPINLFIALGILLSLNSGCNKDEQDYASQIIGTYNGSITVVGTGTVPCSTTVNKNTGSTVDLVITIGSSGTPLNSINVSSSGNSSYSLSYTDSSGSFSGTVSGNKLSWTLEAGGITETFVGTR